MKLHAHQEDLKTAIYKEWEKVPNVLAVAPCGFGKSLVLSNLLIESLKPAVVLAHRAELVFQISNTLARLGIRHNVIAAQSLIKQIIQYQIQNFGKSFYDVRSKVHAASVQTLVKKPDLEKMNVGLWVTDECFPAGTLVDGKPIETIQVGDMVTAFDERDGTFHKRRVVRVFKNKAPICLVQIEFGYHNTIRTTYEHPFWTKRGWIKAIDLPLSDCLLRYAPSKYEGGEPVIYWTDSITKVSQIGHGCDYVYNIEVDELHTYTANGVVVHNCHHLTRGSTWDKCIQRFPGAKGVGFTATPVRADGKGLSRDSHGLFDSMVEGLGARELIEMKYLADYKIYAPATNLDLSSVKIGSGGDYVLEQLREATHKSGIMGDTVRNYQKFAMGKRALVFAVDVESSHQIAQAFLDAGIPAAGVDGTTDPIVRARALRRLESGEILVIVNCDLFGEGTDIPSVEVGIFARKTASFALFYQQFFRAGRTDKDNPGKVAIIIDQVGNVAHHGLPDAYRVWSMDAADKRERGAVKTSVRTCPLCTGVYEIAAHGRTCPYCGETQEPQGRSTPEMVDGDLSELSPDVLAMLRKAGEPELKLPYGASKPIEMRLRRLHGERLETITAVRDSIALWAAGKDDTRRAQREFYREFGVDVLTAQTLPTSEMLNLISKIVTNAL